MPGPFTSDRCLRTFSDQMACTGNGTYHDQYEKKSPIEVYAPEAILSIQLPEAVGTAESMGDLIEHRGFVMLLHYGLVKVIRVKAYA